MDQDMRRRRLTLLHDDLTDHPRMWTAVVRERAGAIERDRHRLARRNITRIEALVGSGGCMYHRAVVFPGQRVADRHLGAGWQEVVVTDLQRAVEDAVAADGDRKKTRLNASH